MDETPSSGLDVILRVMEEVYVHAARRRRHAKAYAVSDPPLDVAFSDAEPNHSFELSPSPFCVASPRLSACLL